MRATRELAHWGNPGGVVGFWYYKEFMDSKFGDLDSGNLQFGYPANASMLLIAESGNPSRTHPSRGHIPAVADNFIDGYANDESARRCA